MNDNLYCSSECDFMLSSQHCAVCISYPMCKEILRMWYVHMYMYVHVHMYLHIYVCIKREKLYTTHFMTYVWDEKKKCIAEQARP